MSGSDRPVISLEVEDSISPGARAAADALNKVADAATLVETKLGRVSGTASSYVNRNDQVTKSANALERAQRDLANAMDAVGRSVAVGDHSQAQYDGTITALQAKVRALQSAHDNGLTPALQRSSLTLGQIAPQFIQFASSIQGGINPLVAFTQQGHQLFDQLAVTGTSVGQLASTIGGGLRTALGAILSPIGLAVTGAALLAGGVYVLGSAAFNAQSRLGDLRQELQAYGQDAGTIVGVSNDLARSTGLSRSALDDLGKSLSTGIQNFQATGAQLKNLELLTRDFAAATGQTLPQAAEKIKSGFTDPYKFALAEMQDGVKTFTADLLVNVATLEAQGKTGEAQVLVLKTLGAATAGAAEPTTDLGKAMRDLSTAFNTAGSGGKTFTEKLGSPFLSALTLAIEQVAKLADELNKVEGGALKVGDVLLSVLNPTPGSTIGAVGSAVATARFGAPAASGGTRSDRNNNPGNLKYVGQAGATGQDSAGFAIFPDYATGLQALQSQLTTYQDKYGINTISGIVNRYAPASDNNDVPAYINSLAARLGTTGSQTLDLHDPGTLQALSIGIAQHEGTTRALPTAATGAAFPSAGPTSADRGETSVADQIHGGDGYTASLQKQQTAINDLLAYQQKLIDSNKQNSTEYRVVTEDIENARQKLQATLPALSAFEKPINDNIALLNAQAKAWAGGAEAAAKATIQQQAFIDAQKIVATTSTNFGTVQESIADALTKQANAQAAIAAAQETSKNNDQMTFLNAEVATLGQDYDTRQKILAALKEKQDLEASGKVYTDQQKQALIDQKVALVGVTDQLQLMQSSLQEVGNFGVQIFDQVGSAITNAFISGQGAAINFGTILKSVAGIALQELGKLAIGNVLSNSIGGTNLPTLFSVANAVAGGGSGGASTTGNGGGALGLLSQGSTLVSGANTLSGGWLGNSLGITGENGLISNVGNYLGFGSQTSGLGGLFANGTNGALAGLGQGVYGPATLAQVQGSAGIFGANGSIATFANTPLFGSATIGSAIGGVGAGYGLGSLAGGYVQSAFDKTGPAPQIGAATGALAGAAIGSIIPGIGTLIGGVAGGLLGGAGGGLIGPHVATPYSSFGINLQGTQATGTLVPGAVLSQGENTAAEQAQFSADVSALNDLIIKSGIRLTDLGGVTQVGNPIAAGETDKVASLSAAVARFGFSVPDTSTDEGRILAGQVNGKSFSGVDQLQAVFTEVDTFINQTVPALKAFDATGAAAGIGSFATAINNLHAMFDPAITEAQKLGFAEQDLTDARDKAVAAAQAQAEQQIQGFQTSIQASYLAAKAQVSGNPADAQAAGLYAFDNVTAAQDRQQLTDEFKGLFGDAYASNVQYVSASVALEQSLAEQRLAVQTQFNGQSTQAEQAAAQAANSSITSLLSYVQRLQGASSSPLSATDQYSLAKSQFNAVSGAAQAGDYNSISNLPTYADALLSASRNVNGSGIGYANDYNSVLSSVSSVANLGADTLTQSFMAAQMQNQTAAIVTAIQSLQSEVGNLKQALSQASQAPARIAA